MAATTFGKYRVIEKIGAGGFGEVFRGLDPVLNRPVAIKTCSSAEEEMRKRFFREAEIAANLQHPNIVTIFDFGYQDETPYLVQEFLAGEDLDHKIRRQEPADVATKVDYLLQIAKGLEYAHSREVVHRDVKPANVRILDDGQIRIMDFGIAKLLTAETQLTRTGMALGTAAYLPPEQIMGLEIDPRADLFSYGVVAYELMTWQRPFAGESLSAMLYAIAHKEPEPLAACGAGCPPRLASLIETCLAKDPDARYPGFVQVIAELENLSSEELSAAPSVPPPAAPPAEAAAPPPPVPQQPPVDGTVQTVAMQRAAPPAAPKRRGAATWILIGAVAAAVLVAAGLGVARLVKRSPEPRDEPEPVTTVADADVPPPADAGAPAPGEPLSATEADAGSELEPDEALDAESAEGPEAASAEPSSPAASRPASPPASPPRRPDRSEEVRQAPPVVAPEEPEPTPPPESRPEGETGVEPAAGPSPEEPPRAPLLGNPTLGLDFGKIAPGLPAYSDRPFIYERVPEAYLDLPSVRTANDFKRSARPLSFSVARDVEVFVAHDQRILHKPVWLESFRRTGHMLSLNEGGGEQKITVYDVFVKDFGAGVVTLGRNVGLRAKKKRLSMYLVFVREK